MTRDWTAYRRDDGFVVFTFPCEDGGRVRATLTTEDAYGFFLGGSAVLFPNRWQRALYTAARAIRRGVRP